MLQQMPVKYKQYYQFENFPNLDLLCAFTTRILGNMSLSPFAENLRFEAGDENAVCSRGSRRHSILPLRGISPNSRKGPRPFRPGAPFYGDTGNALENRKNFLVSLGIDYQNLVCAKQVHGSLTRYIREIDKGKGALSYDSVIADTDALITDKKNVPLSIFTADCLSVFLYDSKTPSIGLVHAGWRSSKENATVKTVQLMQEKFNTEVEDLYVGFGPAIRGCCFEVGGEFTDFFTPEYLIKRDGRYYLDLVGINKKQLLAQGVKDKNIFDSKICTSCRSEEFFSYRKEGIGCGRMMSIMMLR